MKKIKYNCQTQNIKSSDFKVPPVIFKTDIPNIYFKKNTIDKQIKADIFTLFAQINNSSNEDLILQSELFKRVIQYFQIEHDLQRDFFSFIEIIVKTDPDVSNILKLNCKDFTASHRKESF